MSSPVLTNVVFRGNMAASNGGAMINDGYGGTSNPSLTNVTLGGNTASHGGGLYNRGDNGGVSAPTLQNVVLWDNTATDAGSQIYNDNGLPVINYSIVESGDYGIDGTSGLTAFSDGTGNLYDDPSFMDMANGNLNLRADSGAIDTGNNDDAPLTDIRGLTRPVNVVTDMGAYEYQGCVAGVIHVDQAATGLGTGSSWADALTDLSSALLMAASCPDKEIWVAKGMYTPGTDAFDHFAVTPGVTLYGGFAATETLRTDRNWTANVTVLSGDIDNNDIKTATGVITDTANIVGENALHVVSLDGSSSIVTGATVIDGFTVTAGNATGEVSRGGGLFCDGWGNGGFCSPTLANLHFSGNMARNGGAMYNAGNNGGESSPVLTNVSFSGNTAELGGAIYNNSQQGGVSSPVVSNASFSNNTAHGGAIWNDGINGVSSPVLTNVIFISNTADLGGAMLNDGEYSGESSPMLTNVIFSGNRANLDGGAIYNEGYYGAQGSPVLTNVSFSGNTAAGNGGAIYNEALTAASAPQAEECSALGATPPRTAHRSITHTGCR
ncbi:MAG: hypothetical protein IPK16_28605 [Anaerolineales bacterium]|nr:hypothetical protein [Anaerolineales bacterium]